jgi:nicotinamide-nucleotide amidase
MSPHPKLEIINLGDELLIGIRENGHLAYLGGQLTRFGLEIQRNLVIRDHPEDIERFFLESWNHSDVVITTGGLGPTSDDLTRETIAGLLGLELEFKESIRQKIEDRFQRMGRTMTDNNLKQCYLPKGAIELVNEYGTAPGIFLKKDAKILIMLPGPSQELKPMWEHQVIPLLEAEGINTKEQAYLQLRTYGLGESALEAKLKPLLDDREGLHTSFCFHHGIVDLRLSSPSGQLDWESIEKIGEACRVELDEDFVCYGHHSLAKVAFDQLRGFEKSLAIAESCTGGLLSDAFTNIPGASKVFAGGVVCYNNDAKIEMLDVPEPILNQHGAVSAECAVAMVTGVAERFSVDYGLSITGFAGPGGGTPENPVGTIYLGYYSQVGVWSQKLVFSGERLTVKERAVHAALDFLRRKLIKYRVEDFLAAVGTSR